MLALAFAVATAAALVVLTRSWAAPRPVTLLLTVAATLAWPLSGIPIGALVIAILAVGLAAARDRLSPGGLRIDGVAAPCLLVVLGLALTVIGAASADTEVLGPEPTTAQSVATPAAERPASSEAKPREEKQPAKRADATPSTERHRGVGGAG